MEKIVFFGTTEFAAKILTEVTQHFEVLLVVTQSDKPVGRDMEMAQSPVSLRAKELSLDTFKPDSLKEQEAEEELRKHHPDLFIVVAYGQIIPKNILDIAKRGAINIHGSILPKYRGASPIHEALRQGDLETGITIMLMDERMDHGPILKIERLPIGPDEKFLELEERMAELAKQMIIPAVKQFLTGEIQPLPQDDNKATYCKIITKADGKIKWTKASKKIYDKYRSYSKWPGIWTVWGGKKIKITSCRPSRSETSNPPGTTFVENGSLLVQCGAGSLQILELQPEGKKNMPANDFLRGNQKFVGATLE